MSKPIRSALPVRVFPPPQVRPGVMRFLRALGPFYLKGLLGFKSLEMIHPERMVKAFTEFFDLKTRLIVAFRHPYGDEPQLMAYVINGQLVKEAARMGVRFPKKPHAHFIHGYEVPLWANAFERWVLPRVGAVPVHHTKFDSAGMERIRSLMKDGAFPLALAPEGQVSYTSEDVPRIEQGAARIGLWCAEDLARDKRSQTVSILPVSIHHTWPPAAGRALDALISRTESACGACARAGAGRFERLSGIADRALLLMEQLYVRHHGAAFPGAGASRNERKAAVMEAALRTAERAIGIKPDGDAIRRVYKIRQACWERIFRADISDFDALSPAERSAADRLAAEAWLSSRHMELVDVLYYIDFDRLGERDPLELIIETAQNYYDLISRFCGGNLTDRMNVPGKKAVVIIGNPIEVGGNADALKARGKALAESLTEELKKEYLGCIREIRERRGQGHRR